MNKCRNNKKFLEKKAPQEHEEKSEEIQKENGLEKSSKMTVKIILTKEELQWLLSQQKNKEWKSLEDVLGEIQRGREKANVGWKPSLDSINESPHEVLEEEMDR